MSPTVSVAMAVYNGEKYLRTAIESILNQTFVDFEFIIIDDGSTDQSADIVGSYGDQRIRFIRNDCNVGLAASLNTAIDLARGVYLARMDCDDVSLPERLAKQVAFMDANQGVGVCSTWALDIDGEGNVIGKRETLPGDALNTFYWRPSLIHPAAMIRLAHLGDLRYDCHLACAQDYDLWLKIRRKHRLSNLAEHLLLYRVHSESISARKAEQQVRTTYNSFCRHLGGRAISYEAFLALTWHSHKLNPIRRAWATMRVARKLRAPYRVLLGDDIKYLRHWLRAQKIYKFLAGTLALRVLRYIWSQMVT